MDVGRVPFRFDFDPPPLARPLPHPLYQPQPPASVWESATFGRVVHATVRVLASVASTATAAAAIQATKKQRWTEYERVKEQEVERAEQREKEQQEAVAKRAAERAAVEAEEEAKREEEEKIQRVQWEKKQEEKKKREEEKAKQRAEVEKKRKEEAERKRVEQEQRKKEQEQRRKVEEENRRVEVERQRKEEEERKRQEEEKRRVEAERKRKEEEERQRAEEERKAKEEAERKAKEEAERKAKEEAERIRREEEEARQRALEAEQEEDISLAVFPSTPSRRSAPVSHINSITKRNRQSTGKGRVASPAAQLLTPPPRSAPNSAPGSAVSRSGGKSSRVAAALAAEEEAMARAAGEAYTPRTQPPYALGIITPASLKHYGEALKQGFEEMQRKNEAAGGEEALFRSIEMCVPNEDEIGTSFSRRIRTRHNFDVVLVQYHAANHEQPIAFMDYEPRGCLPEDIPRLLLIHRPEEALQRHHQRVFNITQFNIIKRMGEVDAVVLLGEAYRSQLMEYNPNVVVAPHGFFPLDSREQLLNEKNGGATTLGSASFPAIIGSNTVWSDMRWIADLLQLKKEILDKNESLRRTASTPSKASKRGPVPVGPKCVLLYACGRFIPYDDPRSKEAPRDRIITDELSNLQKTCPDQLVLVKAREMEEAVASERIEDAAAFRRWLYARSGNGTKLVICPDVDKLTSESLRSWHSSGGALFDFNTQLFRELLLDFRPKVEYGGHLHAHPGASIPIVFASPSMNDVDIEGVQLIQVPYPHVQAEQVNDEVGASSSSSSSNNSSSSSIAASSVSRRAGPWYNKATYCPDFQPAVRQIFLYLHHPAQYRTHRLSIHESAQQLTMRHVATQYQQIMIQVFQSRKEQEQEPDQ